MENGPGRDAVHGVLSFICAHSGLFRPPISAVEATKKYQVLLHCYITEMLSPVGKRLAMLRPKQRL